jgi:hypothetical protein
VGTLETSRVTVALLVVVLVLWGLSALVRRGR